MKKEHIERGRQDGKSDRTKPAEKTKQNYRLQIKYNSRWDFWCKEGGAKQSVIITRSGGWETPLSPHLITAQ